jgi:hypothetical protein
MLANSNGFTNFLLVFAKVYFKCELRAQFETMKSKNTVCLIPPHPALSLWRACLLPVIGLALNSNLSARSFLLWIPGINSLKLQSTSFSQSDFSGIKADPI